MESKVFTGRSFNVFWSHLLCSFRWFHLWLVNSCLSLTMDILPSGHIFRELQDIHDTGYFSAQPSLDDHWQQVSRNSKNRVLSNCFHIAITSLTYRKECLFWIFIAPFVHYSEPVSFLWISLLGIRRFFDQTWCGFLYSWNIKIQFSFRA